MGESKLLAERGYEAFIRISAENIAKLIEDNAVIKVEVWLWRGKKKHAADDLCVPSEFFVNQSKKRTENEHTHRITLLNFSTLSSGKSDGDDNGFRAEAKIDVASDSQHDNFLPRLSVNGKYSAGLTYVCVLPDDSDHLPFLVKGLRETENRLVREWEENRLDDVFAKK